MLRGHRVKPLGTKKENQSKENNHNPWALFLTASIILMSACSSSPLQNPTQSPTLTPEPTRTLTLTQTPIPSASCATSDELIIIAEELDVSPSPSMGFAVGDLDNDGDMDAVIPRDFGESSIIFPNDGTGRFEPIESGLQTAGSNGINVSLGDVDGDGDLDLLHNCHGCSDSVWVNDGGGVFTQAIRLPVQQGSTTVAVGDFDTDGDADAFFARYSKSEIVWLNQLCD